MATKKILMLMQRISGAYLNRCSEILDRYHLVPPSFHILMFLANHPDLQTAKDISDLLKLKANVISVHVNRLVDSGYLTREPMPGDRRKIRLTLTEKALPVVQEGMAMEKRFCNDLKQGLSEETMEILGNILTVIGENADQILEKGTKVC